MAEFVKGREEEVSTLFDDYDCSAENAAWLIPGGGGIVKCFMPAAICHKMAVFLLDKAEYRAVLIAFTFDLLAIAEALSRAAKRGVDVKVYADCCHTLRGCTKFQPVRFREMKDSGVVVRLTHGSTGKSGLQHSKTLLVDEHLIVGSANWTNSTLSNQECSALIHLNDGGIEAHQVLQDFWTENSTVATDKDLEGAQEVRDNRKKRATSVPHSARIRYDTARKFSLADKMKKRKAEEAQEAALKNAANAPIPDYDNEYGSE